MACLAVIFDLFGTLVPTFAKGPHDDVLEQIADILVVPTIDFVERWVDSYDDRANGRISIEDQIADISAEFGRRASDAQIAEVMQLRYAATRKSLIPRVDAIGALQELRMRGQRIGLISDCSPEPSVLWPETALAPLIDVALFSCIEGLCKPDPRIYAVACDRLRVEPSQCIYVGDGGSDELAGATSVGMYAVQLLAFEHEDEPVGYDDARERWHGQTAKRLVDIVDLIETAPERSVRL